MFITSRTSPFAVFHLNLPIIVSRSEDRTIKIWNSGTYHIKNTFSYALECAIIGIYFVDRYLEMPVIAHLPLASHPNPKKVLVIGRGDELELI